MKNLVIGSKRCKSVFYRVGTVEVLFNLLKEFSSANKDEALIELIDCLSSFAKSSNKNLVHRLIELGCIQQLFVLLSTRHESVRLCEAALRCLRSFFLPKSSPTTFSKVDYSNPFLTPIPFVLLCEQDAHKPPSLMSQTPKLAATPTTVAFEPSLPIELLFGNAHSLDVLLQLLPVSKAAQLSIVEILCCLCVNNERQQQLMEKNWIPAIIHLLVQNTYDRQQQQHDHQNSKICSIR